MTNSRFASTLFADTYRKRFLGLVAELPERFGVQIATFVLVDNHYHLVVQTSDPNLSDAVRWLQESYSIRFNWANGLCGHVFQGRFRAMVRQGASDVIEVARYVHLGGILHSPISCFPFGRGVVLFAIY